MSRVLLIDDDPTICEVLTEVLELDHYEVRARPDLAGGLRLLAEEAFDLVLTDLFSPTFSPAAFAPVQELTQATSDIPIVVATAFAEAGNVDPASVGAADIILKPFEINDLLSRVRRVLLEGQAQLRGSQAAADAAWDVLRSAQTQLGTNTAFRYRHPLPDQDRLPDQ
jgi:DNA-binding response OmpR family regulator